MLDIMEFIGKFFQKNAYQKSQICLYITLIPKNPKYSLNVLETH